MPTPPALTRDERLAALAKAQEARHMVAETKKALRRNLTSIDKVFESENIYIRRMKVRDVLLAAIHGAGAITVADILSKAEIKPQRRISGLTYFQKKKIYAEIARRYA